MTTPFEFDPGDPVHARSLARLESERIGWLGTVGRDGYPHAVPIWFLWHEGRVLIFSEPRTAKVRDIRENDRVLLHLEAGADGERFTVMKGVAALSPDPASEWLDRVGEAYGQKYRSGLAGLKLTLPEMAARYSVVIEIIPHKLLAW